MDKESLDKLLTKSKIDMLLHQPFFASVIMSLPIISDENCPGAMGTDGIALYYNPKLIETHTKENIKMIFAHEAMHITNLHHLRQGNRKELVINPQNGQVYTLWNIAADYAINYQLKQAGFIIPEGCCDDDNIGKFAAEKIYDILLQKMKKDKKAIQIPAENMRGDINAPKGANGKEMTGVEKKILEAKTKDMIKNASEAAKKAGKLPAGIERYVKELFEHKVNWKEAIAQFVCKYSRNDYDWSKRSRRYSKFYLPSLKSPEVGRLIIGIDTSGSLSEKDLSEIASELMGIISTYNGIQMTIIYCDSHVNRVENHDPFDTLKLKMVGGGGTDYRPVFKEVEKLDEEPVALLYFTDGYCDSFPKKVPDYPVMWILTYKNEHFNNTFGSIIHIRNKNEEGY